MAYYGISWVVNWPWFGQAVLADKNVANYKMLPITKLLFNDREQPMNKWTKKSLTL